MLIAKMTTIDIIRALDAEIARLQQVRPLLAGGSAAPKKRILSAAARAKIAAAQKKRWAKAKNS
jgi:hypothetical protein